MIIKVVSSFNHLDTFYMVIAFDAKRLFTNFTGLGNYSRTLVKNIQKYYPQHQYHLFSPKIVENDETRYFLDQKRFILHSSSEPLWRTYKMSRIINDLKPDIYHGLSHEIPLGLNSDIKKVVTFHDLIYEIYPKQFGIWDRNMYKLKYKRAAKVADMVVCISKSTQKDLTELYKVPTHKTCVVYQSCQDVFQEKPDGRVNLNLPEVPYYLYVGSVIPRKNLKTIIEAFAQLTDEDKKPFVVVGSGPKTYLEETKGVISKLRLQKWFHFITHVDNHQLVQIYQNSRLLCYPSVYEGFGIPVIESLFLKKPVITSNLSSLPEAAGPGGILVNPFIADEITNAFLMMQHEAVYQKHAQEGYDYVKNHFSMKVTADRIMEVYSRLIL